MTNRLIPPLNIILIALLAEALENFSHELVHAIIALAVGGKIQTLSFWGVDWKLPTGLPIDTTMVAEILIAGSAAIANICFALIGIWALAKFSFSIQVDLALIYFTAYSLFAGFGYLFFDPLFASPESSGDWERVVILLGGDWENRIIISLIGAMGTLFGYFWLGYVVEKIFSGNAEDSVNRKSLGAMICIAPYVGVNAIFSLLVIGHPLGLPGIIAVLLKLWLGFVGFFWAYMIRFYWGKPTQHPGPVRESQILLDLQAIEPKLILTVVVVILLIVFPLSKGIHFA